MLNSYPTQKKKELNNLLDIMLMNIFETTKKKDFQKFRNQNSGQTAS